MLNSRNAKSMRSIVDSTNLGNTKVQEQGIRTNHLNA